MFGGDVRVNILLFACDGVLDNVFIGNVSSYFSSYDEKKKNI